MMNPLVVIITAGVLGLVWGRVEVRVQSLRAGQRPPILTREESGSRLAIAQGIISLAVFALIGVSFWRLGWKVSLAAMFVAFGLGAVR